MNRRGMFKFKGTAEVDGQIAAEAELICAIKDK
jgi:3-hydroxymyristoyl/3-hydroxydecanoyl-(acyl carrier protein) dehydratase